MGVKVKERIPGSGVFWIFIDHNGRRKAKKVGSEEAAKKAKALIEPRLVLGNSALPEAKPVSPTLEEYFKRFEKAYLDTAAIRNSSRRNYRSMFSHHILPELKFKRLDEITRENIQEFIVVLVRKNLAKGTIRLILANLGCFLNHAREAGIIRDNPATRLSKFYKQTKRVHDKIQPLTAAEVLVFPGERCPILHGALFPAPVCHQHGNAIRRISWASMGGHRLSRQVPDGSEKRRQR